MAPTCLGKGLHQSLWFHRDRQGLRSSSHPAADSALLPEGRKLSMGNQLSLGADSTHTNPASHSAKLTQLQGAKEMVSVWKGCYRSPGWLGHSEPLCQYWDSIMLPSLLPAKCFLLTNWSSSAALDATWPLSVPTAALRGLWLLEDNHCAMINTP